MRVALAQINPTVGDIAGNEALAIDAICRARSAGCDLTLLPELVLTGYPPEDLLLKEHFITENLAALKRVSAVCDRPVVVGFVDSTADGIFNAAALCEAGAVREVYHKRRLPNYGVFDEERYFSAGQKPAILEVAGVQAALTVCEDVWVPELATEAASLGATVLLNISASPFHVGKGSQREEMLRSRARDHGMWLAYVNLVGGQDELVFDGRSVVISPEGEVCARGKLFGEDLVIAEVGDVSEARSRVVPEIGRADEVYGALLTGLRDYVRKNGFGDVVLGLSGGIDSALSAAVAVDALGSAHVHGVMMPGPYSSGGSIADARALADALGIEVREIGIGASFDALTATLGPSFEGCTSDVTEENLQARVRGALLMALSNKFGWLVLATGNKSELSVGYSTLYGDMVGGFAPLKDVFKMRVYELARWRNQRGAVPVIPQATIDKAPSAELRANQTDQDSLPPYEVLDAVLQRYVEDDKSLEDIVAEGFERSLVERVIRLTDAAEYKRRQGPMGVKITPKAFGKDRRMPVTNRFRG